MAETLFRSRPLPAGLVVFDAHVNALPAGTTPPDGIYTTVDVDEVLADGAGTGTPDDAAPSDIDAPRFHGGCLAPPAGIDLLEGSRALRERSGRAGGHGWGALLRLDAGGGARPVAGPLGGPRSSFAGLRARDGRVGQAVLETPDLLDGFVGVKLMPQATGLPGDDVLAALAARSLPLLVHAGILCPPRWIERHLLARYDGPVILAHLGSWPCAADDLAYAVELAAREEQVHLETSGANIGNFIRHAVERVPEKILFGSNRPMCPPAVQFAHVAASIHDDDTLRAVARGNAERLFPHARAERRDATGSSTDAERPPA